MCGPAPVPALGPVEVDDVRAALRGHPDVVVDTGRAELELDRDLVVGRLADLLDLEREVVGPQPVRMAGGRALVDPGREGAHLGDLLGHLLAHQVPAEPDLAALADEELDRVREHQVVRVEPVPALDALVVPLGRVVALGRDHPALARAGRGPGHGRAPGERHLRLQREGAEAHPRDVDGDVELERLPGEAGAQHRRRVAFLAIALDHEPGQRARQEDELVPVRDPLEDREAAHPVAAQLGLHVDVVDHLGREDAAPPEHLSRARAIFGHVTASSPLPQAAGGFRGVPARRAGFVAVSVPLLRNTRSQAAIRSPASSRRARASRSCRAPSRRRTSGARAGRRGRRCGTSARRARCRPPSTRRGRSRSRAT